eukprot:m.174461 g.174461  ORF g.174461 m.174461 type:complete len:92 (+) comp16751_c0_seq31:2267-2542(+)
MENELCRTACSANNLGPLRVNDQLTRERAEERVFASFSEAHIDFLPTYKYDMLTDDYDTSDKQRVPAWTDRVQVFYTPIVKMALSFFSTHF